MTGLGLPLLAGLAVLGLVAGVGITAIGPGGVLVTIGLFTLTGLSPAEVAVGPPRSPAGMAAMAELHFRGRNRRL